MNRRLVVAACVALMALTLVGCGGGEEPAPTTTTAPPPPPSAAPVATNIADRSREESAVFAPLPTGDFLPAEVAQRLQAVPKQPMILFFYDDAQLETDDARKEVVAARDANRGAIDLIEYNLGEYTSVDASGVVTVDTALDEDEPGQQAVRLAREIGVNYTPYGVIIDDQGYMIFRWRGYIDAQILEEQVARTKP